MLIHKMHCKSHDSKTKIYKYIDHLNKYCESIDLALNVFLFVHPGMKWM